MDLKKLQAASHRRYNPLLREWVLVSPNRVARPWQGQMENAAPQSPTYDPDCYLCPGNPRAGGACNPEYRDTFVFDNDFSSLQPQQADLAVDEVLLTARTERGICRVVCFAPRHDLTLARMPVDAVGRVVDVWVEEYRQLGDLPFIHHVQIFENRGEVMGCSNPHPHGQIWANETVPNEPRKEGESMLAYRKERGACLLCDYANQESTLRERVVCENSSFLVVVPFWAIWPFETLLLGKEHVSDINALDSKTRADLADILKKITTRYDNLFETAFPYSFGFHQRPTDGKEHPEWHFHGHFLPPLLRSATIKKFMVGYELLASPQRDFTPEVAAEKLRQVSEQHYSSPT